MNGNVVCIVGPAALHLPVLRQGVRADIQETSIRTGRHSLRPVPVWHVGARSVRHRLDSSPQTWPGRRRERSLSPHERCAQAPAHRSSLWWRQRGQRGSLRVSAILTQAVSSRGQAVGHLRATTFRPVQSACRSGTGRRARAHSACEGLYRAAPRRSHFIRTRGEGTSLEQVLLLYLVQEAHGRHVHRILDASTN